MPNTASSALCTLLLFGTLAVCDLILSTSNPFVVMSFSVDCTLWKQLRLCCLNLMANGSSPGADNDAINTTNIKHAGAGSDMALGDIADGDGANWATTRFHSGASGWQTVVVATRRRGSYPRLRYQSRKTLGFSHAT